MSTLPTLCITENSIEHCVVIQLQCDLAVDCDGQQAIKIFSETEKLFFMTFEIGYFQEILHLNDLIYVQSLNF